MDKAEKTNLKVFLDHLYQNALTYTYSSPKTILGDSIKDWFNLDIKGNAEGTDEHCFVDAMLQGKTTCAAHHMMKIFAEPDSRRKEYLNRKIQLLIWSVIGDDQFESDDPITRMTEMFVSNNLDFELLSEYGHEFLGILHVSKEVCEANTQRVAEAATYLVDKWLVEDKMWKNTPASPDSIMFKSNQPFSPTDDPDGENTVVLKEGETAHVELTPYDYDGKTEQMCTVTLHIAYGQSCWSFRPLEKVIPGDYVAKGDVTRAQLQSDTYEVNQDPNGDGKHMYRVIPAKVSKSAVGVAYATTPATPKEAAVVPEGATEPYYEKMKEVLHRIAELSTVTNGGHTGCTHNATSWAEEFMRNVTALFSYDITRNIHTDTVNKYDRLETTLIGRLDDRSRDNTVLSNIGSVLQIIKMLACVRRDNVQDHPTPHGYEYVIDYNKYWSMIKQLYGIDLSDTPKYTNDHRYHLMAALKGAAD